MLKTSQPAHPDGSAGVGAGIESIGGASMTTMDTSLLLSSGSNGPCSLQDLSASRAAQPSQSQPGESVPLPPTTITPGPPAPTTDRISKIAGSGSSSRPPAPLRPYRSQPLHPTTFLTDQAVASCSTPSLPSSSGSQQSSPTQRRPYKPGTALSSVRSTSMERDSTFDDALSPNPNRASSASTTTAPTRPKQDLTAIWGNGLRRVIGYAEDDPELVLPNNGSSGLGIDSIVDNQYGQGYTYRGAVGAPDGADIPARPTLGRTPSGAGVSGADAGEDQDGDAETDDQFHAASRPGQGGSLLARARRGSALNGTGRELGGGDVLDLGEEGKGVEERWEEEYRRRIERGSGELEMDPTSRYHRHQQPPTRMRSMDPTLQSLRTFFSLGSLPKQPEDKTTLGGRSTDPANSPRRTFIGNAEVDSAGFGQSPASKSLSPPRIPPRGMPSSWSGLVAPKRSPSGSSILSLSEGRGVILTPTTQEWRELGMESPIATRADLVGSERDPEGRRGSDSEASISHEDELSNKRSSWGTVNSIGNGDETPGQGSIRKASSQHRRSQSASSVPKDHLEDAHSEAWRADGRDDHDHTLCNLTRGDLNVSSSRPDRVESAVRESHAKPSTSRDGSRSAPAQMEEEDLFAALFALQQARAQEAKGVESEGARFDLNALGLSKSTFHAVESLLPPSLLNRSQSVRITSEPEKRKEKERDRLFRMVGEDIEQHGIEPPTSSWGVKQVGSGWALDYIPPAREMRTPPPDREDSGWTHVPTKGDLGSDKLLPIRRSATLAAPVPVRLSSTSPISPSPLSHVAHIEDSVSQSSQASKVATRPRSRKPTRQHPRSRRPSHNPGEVEALPAEAPAPLSPITSRRRQSQRLSMLAGRTPQPFAFPAALPPSGPTGQKKLSGLSAFSPFHSSPPKKNSLTPLSFPQPQPMSMPPHLQHIGRSDSIISIAPSIGAPTPSGTPVGEIAEGAGGHGINDYVIISEAGRGAYGMVKRARQLSLGANEPFGEEVIIKYIIKSRILADCWKKHKILGPIPIEIHVMDQLRNVITKAPSGPLPWDPLRPRRIDTIQPKVGAGEHTPTNASPMYSPASSSDTPLAEKNALEWTARISADEVHGRGHPNVCKMLDFFEDKEFYYRKYFVMPRFGVGLDLFDRIESAPNGLDPFDIRSLLGQLSDALRFLHANGIVHRDIKDENVILDGDGHCQLIDFGSAAHWRPYRKWDTFSGTLDYASPEILRGETYGGKEQDVWALGIVAFVLIAGETPFLSADEAQVGFEDGSKASLGLAERCFGARGEEGLEADGGGQMKDAMDFVERCCEPELGDRPSADNLVMHRFIVGREGWTGHRGWLEESTEVLKSS